LNELKEHQLKNMKNRDRDFKHYSL